VKWVRDLACVVLGGWCGYRSSGVVCYCRLIYLDIRYHLMFVENYMYMYT
jgi:hypothetical protein